MYFLHQVDRRQRRLPQSFISVSLEMSRVLYSCQGLYSLCDAMRDSEMTGMRPLLHQLSGKGRIDADLIGDLGRGDQSSQKRYSTVPQQLYFFSFSWQKRNMLDHYNAMECEQ